MSIKMLELINNINKEIKKPNRFKTPRGVCLSARVSAGGAESLGVGPPRLRPAANRWSPLRLEPLVSHVGAGGRQLRPPNFGWGEMTETVWNMRSVNKEPGRILGGGKKKELCLDHRDCGMCEGEAACSALRCLLRVSHHGADKRN